METTKSRKFAELKRRGLLANVIEGDNVLIFKSHRFLVDGKRN